MVVVWKEIFWGVSDGRRAAGGGRFVRFRKVLVGGRDEGGIEEARKGRRARVQCSLQPWRWGEGWWGAGGGNRARACSSVGGRERWALSPLSHRRKLTAPLSARARANDAPGPPRAGPRPAPLFGVCLGRGGGEGRVSGSAALVEAGEGSSWGGGLGIQPRLAPSSRARARPIRRARREGGGADRADRAPGEEKGLAESSPATRRTARTVDAIVVFEHSSR